MLKLQHGLSSGICSSLNISDNGDCNGGCFAIAMAVVSFPSLHHKATLSSSLLNPTFLPSKPSTSLLTKSSPKTKRALVVSMSMEAGIGVMGSKLGMMSFFEADRTVVPVTVVGFRKGNIVTQIKTVATDGYDAVQIGYRRVRDKKLTKPETGHLEKAGVIPMRHLQEFRLTSVEGFETNQKLVFDEIFKEGDLVDVAGTTIGKGFQRGIKRHHFKRGQMTHGSKSHRALGSIGVVFVFISFDFG